jgi:hypothetical protein
MRYDAVEFGPAAMTALDSLKLGVRARVLPEIEDLMNDPESRPNVFVSHWAGARFELRPNGDPSIVVLFEPHDDTRVIEVVDMIRPENLRSILRGAVSSSPSA